MYEGTQLTQGEGVESQGEESSPQLLYPASEPGHSGIHGLTIEGVRWQENDSDFRLKVQSATVGLVRRFSDIPAPPIHHPPPFNNPVAFVKEG